MRLGYAMWHDKKLLHHLRQIGISQSGLKEASRTR